MPKITKHGGASNEAEGFVSPQDVAVSPSERDVLLTLGDQEIELTVRKVDANESVYLTPTEDVYEPPVEEKEVAESVGNNSSLSSKPTPTIEQLLETDPQ